MTSARGFAAVAAALACAACAPTHAQRTPQPQAINDVSRLNPTVVYDIERPREDADFMAALDLARRQTLKVSISGKRHSQGGHAFYPGALVLDTTDHNRILALDEERKVIRVQSGTTWRQVQDYANRSGLAVKVMQSSNIFTVGGSLSVNAHGRDPNFGPIIETVESFRLLLPTGQIVNVSRTENADLFALAIGGYGLFGVILDVDLSLTENAIYEKRVTALDHNEYPSYFAKNIRGHTEVGLHYARLSVAPGSFLREMYATSYHVISVSAGEAQRLSRLDEDEPVVIPQVFLGLARTTEWGKSLEWYLEKKLVDPPGIGEHVSRNNAMRPPVAFLAYDSPTDTDILQEYFVPPEAFEAFVDGMRNLFARRRVNLLNVTVRYEPANREAFLPYAQRESFAIVLYINQRLSPEGVQRAREWTRELVDLCLSLNGTFYLPYQLYPTAQQVRQAYPMWEAFIAAKLKVDPEQRFSSGFYEAYRKQE